MAAPEALRRWTAESLDSATADALVLAGDEEIEGVLRNLAAGRWENRTADALETVLVGVLAKTVHGQARKIERLTSRLDALEGSNRQGPAASTGGASKGK